MALERILGGPLPAHRYSAIDTGFVEAFIDTFTGGHGVVEIKSKLYLVDAPAKSSWDRSAVVAQASRRNRFP
jgi:hypothetical protein